MRTALYRHFDADGLLLYVGISLNSIARTKQHSKGAAWFQDIARIDIEWLSTRPEAEAAEIKAIQSEFPLHNIAHASSRMSNRQPWQGIVIEPWATNEVRCRGQELHREIWRGVQWAVTEYGVECRDGTYCICRSRIREGEEVAEGQVPYPWEKHMKGKCWTNVEDFNRAMQVARMVFPKGTKALKIGFIA